MRLFTAIPLPDSVRGELAVIQPQHPDIRLTPESQLHLTLRFIGETDKNRTRRILKALSHVSFRPFEITLMGTGCFPSPAAPSILWVGVRYHPILRELYDGMQEELYRSGISNENRSYHPHVTLGRIRKAHKTNSEAKVDMEKLPLEQVLDQFFNGESSDFQVTFPVDRFSLYHSRLHSGGAIHHCLQEYMAS